MKKIKIPFINGNLVYFPYDFHKNTEWKENYEFKDTLKLKGMYRGCSAANFELTNSEGKRYTMFMKDLFDVCQNGTVKNGTIKGRFCFCKRGKNYGVKWLGN